MNTEETALERLLRHASTEVGLRPEFYKRLLDSDVLVPVEPTLNQHGVIAPGSILAIKCLVRADGVSVIPFFSSADTVFEASPAGEKCVSMTVRELFQSKGDMHFHLNPFSSYGREFVPREVASLLATSALGDTISEFIPDSEELSLAPPQNPPIAMLQDLCVLFARNFQVKAAFAAEMSHPGKGISTTLLIAVDVVSDIERIMQEAATVVRDSLTQSLTVDLSVIRHDESPVSKYFYRQATPFYEIGWAARFLPN